MKTIGLIGGMSWESSLEYYRIINESVRDQLGGLHSAKIILYSFNFAEIAALQNEGNWDAMAAWLIGAAQTLEQAGAEVLAICTNTMHKVADPVQKNVTIPLVHIADATAEAIQAKGLRKIGLLGTKFTMEQDFYTKRLADKYGLDAIIPADDERNAINHVIFDELCCGQVKSSSKEQFCTTIHNLAANGAEGIILGCTEIGLLVHQQDVKVPLFDTAIIHAQAVARFALEQSNGSFQ
ncbi:MAG: aspartate/glutamate racemase family protein [Sedimentisphaerales bacterium]|nr:aspartate/glutamate racemase family protein [Sedimentisphaerales bacterium]